MYARPNSFHMNDARLQEALERQEKQRLLRQELDSQMAQKRAAGDSLDAMANTNGLTKVQLKRLQIEREKELEATQNRASINDFSGTFGRGQVQGRPPSMGGPAHQYGAQAGMNQPRLGGPEPSLSSPLYPGQQQQQQPPSPSYGQGGYPPQSQPPGGYPQQQYHQQQYPHQQQQQYGSRPPTHNQPPAPHQQQPFVGNSTSSLPMLPNRSQPAPGDPASAMGNVRSSTNFSGATAPPYEVREESIYNLEEKENKHKDLMSMVSRVADIDQIQASAAAGAAKSSLKPKESPRDPYTEQRPQARERGGERGRERGPRAYPTTDAVVDEEMEMVQRPRNPSKAGRDRSGRQVDDGEGQRVPGSRTSSRDPGGRRVPSEAPKEDRQAKVKAQRLERELVEHQRKMEKMREKERNWESQVSKLKQELKQARTREARANPGVKQTRAETAPNESGKHFAGAGGKQGGPPMKKPHRVKPLDGREADGGGRQGKPDFNGTVKYDEQSFRPITAPNFDSTVGSQASDGAPTPPLPPLAASRDRYVDPPPTMNQTKKPAVREKPPPARAPIEEPVVYSPPAPPPPRQPTPPSPPKVMTIKQLREFVTTRVITATQAEALWESFTGDRVSIIPTPPPGRDSTCSAGQQSLGKAKAGTYSRPRASIGLEEDAPVHHQQQQQQQAPPTVATYETFDSFEQDAEPNDDPESSPERGAIPMTAGAGASEAMGYDAAQYAEGEDEGEDAPVDDNRREDQEEQDDVDDAELQDQYDEAYANLS